MTGALTAATWLAAAATKKSSFSPIIIIYAVIAAAFYFLYYRPRKRKAQEAREQGNAWEVGDEVLTAGGIVGYIIDVDGDRVTLETSVGASFVVLKQYVIRKIEPVVPDDDEDDDDLELEDHDGSDDQHDEVDDDQDADHDEVEDEAEGGHAGHDDEDEDGEAGEPDDEAEAAGPPAAPGAGTGNRRSRRRGLRHQSEGGEDPSDNDGPPTV